MKSGLFITFEGLEGSGKSTQLGLLASKLKEENLDILATREPGGTRIGEQIRSITHNRENVDLTAVSEAYLMAASRAQHVREIIRPAIQAGKIVLCDRFIDSSLAYQGYGRQLGEVAILELNHMALDGLTPDFTFFLDVAVETGMKRRNGNAKIDRLDLQQKDFYIRVNAGYQELVRKYPERIIVVDANGSIEDTANSVYRIFKEKKSR